MQTSVEAAGGEMQVSFPGYFGGCVGAVCAVPVCALALYVPIRGAVVSSVSMVASLNFRRKQPSSSRISCATWTNGQEPPSGRPM